MTCSQGSTPHPVQAVLGRENASSPRIQGRAGLSTAGCRVRDGAAEGIWEQWEPGSCGRTGRCR